MYNYDIGIVLVRGLHAWDAIVLKSLIYIDGRYEIGIHKLIMRQTALKSMNINVISPVVIIMDNVLLHDINIREFGVTTEQEFIKLLCGLFINIIYAQSVMVRQRLFPAAWAWSTYSIHMDQIYNLSKEKSKVN